MSSKCNCEAAAYALGALEERELMGFRAHMESCTVCREEVVSMQVLVDMLALAAPPRLAPRALKRRVMGVVEQEAAAARRASEGAEGGRRASGRRWRPFPAFAGSMALVAAAAAIILVLAGAPGAGTRSSTPSTPTAVDRLISASVSGRASTGQAALRESGSHSELIVARMPPPPARHIYEVWLSRPGRAELYPTNALFNVASDGSATVDVPGSLRGVRAVLVTTEPIGGSRKPSGRPIITAPLS